MMILSANWLLLLPLLAIAAILLSKRKKNAPAKLVPVIVPKAEPQKTEPILVLVKKAEPPKEKIKV
jgi:hypothetical protein